MITQIIGRLVEKSPTQVVIDCHGIGYEVNISLNKDVVKMNRFID